MKQKRAKSYDSKNNTVNFVNVNRQAQKGMLCILNYRCPVYSSAVYM